MRGRIPKGYWRILDQAFWYSSKESTFIQPLKVCMQFTAWQRSIDSWTMSEKMAAHEARPHCSCDPNRLRKNYYGTMEIQWSTCLGQWENTRQDAQKVRPARPQHAKRRCVLCSVRRASEQSENAAWEKARLGAPGSGG